MKILHYSILVKGKVQGVWFRKYTYDKAQALGIKGFVKNEINLHVYIEAEGPEHKLTDFINWLQEGSPFSKVAEVIVQTGELQSFKEFKIIR